MGSAHDDPALNRATEPKESVTSASEPRGDSKRAQSIRRGSLLWRLGGLASTLRPHQWVKNVFVLAPVVFAKEIFSLPLLARAAIAFGVFCLLAGAVYTMNDLADVEADRRHPVKRHRPIASGRLDPAWARVSAAGLIVISLSAGAWLDLRFFVVALVYLLQNIAYSKRLKHIAYLDVGCIATGFVLRVMAGGYATRIGISWYLLVCTALLALFLGFGKRRHELAAGARASKQRQSLESYGVRGLDIALGLTATATVAAYLLYTLDPHTRALFRTDWLWPSSIFVVLGVLRFLTLVRSRPKAESPTQEMLRDGPFVAILMGWIAAVLWIVYQLRPGP